MNNRKQIDILIVDDEKHSRESVILMLENNYPNSFKVHEADSVSSAIHFINEYKPKIVFLDVELPDGIGFDILESLKEFDFHIIFITAYNYYAIKAIKFAALDYLLKPIDQIEFKNALDKALCKLSIDKQNDNLNFLKKQLDVKKPTKIALPTEDGFTFLFISDIIHCQSESNYTIFYTTNKKKLVVSKTLKEYEELLCDFDFCRVHNSHLINMAYVKSYCKGKTGSVELSDGTVVPVSIRRKEKFLEKFARL